MAQFIEQNQKTIIRIIRAVGGLLALFLLVSTIVKLKEYKYIGVGLPASGQTITVAGKGEINRAPDTAKISFTVTAQDKLVKNAQQTVSDKMDAVTKALKDLGIDAKYIKTDSYNSYPQYAQAAPCYGSICPEQASKIIGYEVSHSVTVDVKNLDSVEGVLGALGTAGVSNISGPNFGFEDDTAVEREARDLAIADARQQAELLAKSLGVKLVRLTSFSENGGGYPQPVYAAMGMAADSKSAAPTVPVGNQDITSQVSLTYEIR